VTFTAPKSPGKALHINNALFYMAFSLDAMGCIIVTILKKIQTTQH